MPAQSCRCVTRFRNRSAPLVEQGTNRGNIPVSTKRIRCEPGRGAVGILLALLATHALQKGYFVLGTPITLNGAKKIKALSLPHRPTVTEANPSATNGKTGTARPLETEKRKHDAACMPQRQALHHPLLVAPRVVRELSPAGGHAHPRDEWVDLPGTDFSSADLKERKKTSVRPGVLPAIFLGGLVPPVRRYRALLLAGGC
jgi:hypothetical protein